MSEQISLYGENAITSGELTAEELALLDNGAAIRDGDEDVDVSVETPAEETPEEKQEETPAETPEETPAEGSDEAIQKGVESGQKAMQELGADLTAKGVDTDALLAELQSTGELSPESYEALSKAGYSKGVIDSIIAGQVAQSSNFINSIISHAGGQAGFEQLVSFAQANAPQTIPAYNAAVERGDLVTAKALLDGLKAQRTSKFGTRNPHVEGRPTPSAAAAVKGYESQDDMVAAMSDKRYGRDAKYTQEVERKVQSSTFW